MAQPVGNSRWMRGKVKVVLSGDSLVIMGMTKAEIPPEKTIVLAHLSAPRLACRGGLVLAHLSAPRLACRGGQDELFEWDSR
ncbi:putative micrococcal nuclease [Helianthus anomalus]